MASSFPRQGKMRDVAQASRAVADDASQKRLSECRAAWAGHQELGRIHEDMRALVFPGARLDNRIVEREAKK